MRYFQISHFAMALAVAAVGVARPAWAEVIFEENFAARPNGAGVFGTAPDPTNTGGAVYSKNNLLAGATLGTIGYYGDTPTENKGLKFQPMDVEHADPQMAGNYWQTMYLPYQHTFGTDAVRFTIVARQEAAWNNFIFGFTDTDNNASNFVLLQENPGVMNPDRDRIQLWHNSQIYQRNWAEGFSSHSFREFVLEYDPTKASTVGVSPYSFFVDGTPIPFDNPGMNATNLAPMTTTGGQGASSMQGIAWGFWHADGNMDRSVVIESLKFEIFTPGPSNDPGDFNGDGLVDGADFLAWQRGESPNGLDGDDLQEWKDNFPVGASPAAAPIPEPASAAILAVGAAALLFARQRRRLM